MHDLEDAGAEGEDSSLQPPSSLFILRGDERPPREMVIVVGGKGTLLMVYIA